MTIRTITFDDETHKVVPLAIPDEYYTRLAQLQIEPINAKIAYLEVMIAAPEPPKLSAWKKVSDDCPGIEGSDLDEMILVKDSNDMTIEYVKREWARYLLHAEWCEVPE